VPQSWLGGDQATVAGLWHEVLKTPAHRKSSFLDTGGQQ
jgi:hypothetical protein